MTGRWSPDGAGGSIDERSKTKMTTIRLNVPPDQTPEEEAALVARVAAAYESSTGRSDVTVELNRPEEVDYQAVSDRTHASSRWSS
jgi:hypothetical protein